MGSFVSSFVGSFAYSLGYNVFISFCVDTGFTMFGMVNQNYELPDEVLEAVGFNVFNYEEFTFEEFQVQEFETESILISFLRRGVIGVQQIGYM